MCALNTKWMRVSAAILISNINNQLLTVYNRDNGFIVEILKFEKKFCELLMTA